MFKQAMLVWSVIVGTSLSSPLLPRIAWQVETSAPAEKRLDLKYGETIDLQCRFLSYAESIDILGGTVILHARTNGMDEGSSYQIAGTASAAGLATVRLPVDSWVPQGLTNVAYTLEVTQTNAVRILRATGTAWLTGTSVASSNAPVPTVCASNLFAAIVSATNALSASTSAQIVSSTGALAQATASQIVVATGTLDTAVSLRITSATGAVLQASLSALASYASTNKVVRFYDFFDPSVWWVANGGTNLTAWTIAYPVWTITATGTDGQDGTFQVIQPTPLLWPTDSTGTYAADGGWSVIHLPDSIYVINAEIGGGTIGWYNNYSSGDPAGLTAYNSFISEDPAGTVSLVRSGSISTNIVGSYNLTTGNVWQAVIEAKAAASDALLAADQAATLINYHTTLDTAPHAGKFVSPQQLTNNTSHVMAQWYAADGSLTQQIVRTGAEIWTNRWPAGVTGAITNGATTAIIGGATFSGGGAIDSNGGSISCQNIQPNNAVYFPSKGILMWATAAIDDSDNAYTFANASGNVLKQIKASSVRVSDTETGSAGVLIKKDGTIISVGTNTAAVIVSRGPVFFGPVINGKQMFLDGDGTNAWTVNVNSVTNSL